MLKKNKIQNLSPWLTEIDIKRETTKLNNDIDSTIVIVGGGISGIATAYYILKNTTKSVTVLEGNKIARGATGHNAGHLYAGFEKPFKDLVNEFGLEMASEGYLHIQSAWTLLENMILETGIHIPYTKLIAYAGYISLDQIIDEFEDDLLKREAGIDTSRALIAAEALENEEIDPKYRELYDIVPKKEILHLLETDNTDYVAATKGFEGVMNSALLVEKIVNFLKNKYEKRFNVFEETLIDTLTLYKDYGILKTSEGYKIKANRVVLCTNGFEHLNIINKEGENINSKFHKSIYSIIGYMAAYTENRHREQRTFSYNNKDLLYKAGTPYIYLSRRDFGYRGNIPESLVTIGGPQRKFKDDIEYDEKTRKYPEKSEKEIKEFLSETFKSFPKHKKKFDFKWHGLMGYTDNGVRKIGVEPRNPVLLYNLGCNGVGLLPSIYGGKKISEHIGNKRVKKSIFDPN